MSYKVDLDIYNGPMDLLLYLIRREEVEITDLPIARIADQYVAYLDVLQTLDIELAGEFVVMAATLLELKSRALLPRPPDVEDQDEEAGEDPRETLIRQLIEYRRFKEAASLLDGRGRDMARRFPREFDDRLLDDLEGEMEDETLEPSLEGIQVWDLISAFSDIMRTVGYSRPREVIYDDTPVEELAQKLLGRLQIEKSVLFADLFVGGRSIAYCITMFLAVLELVRQRHIGAEQAADFKDLRIFLRDPEAEDPVTQSRPKGARESRDALKRKHPRRPSARQVGAMAEEIEFEKTEFDEILDSIAVPEVETFRPIYSDGELMGRKDEAGSDEPDGPAPAADASGAEGDDAPPAGDADSASEAGEQP